MNATTVQNVVTYNTVIDFDNPDTKLFPGMTAYITLPVASAKSVLRVPNGALRYKPDMKPEDIRALYQKYGLTSGEQASASVGGAANSGGAAGRQARAQGAQGGGGDAGQPRVPRMDVSVIWKLRPDKTLEPVKIRTGITDHTVTEVAQVLNGQVNEGDQLITGAINQTSSASSARPPGAASPATPRGR